MNTAGRRESDLAFAHTHHFGQDRRRPGEARTVVVTAVTAAMMVVEIGAGVAFGSMALLADGLHMGSHAVALGISVFAYVYARRRAHDGRFNFGTGKVNALGGYTGAVLLALFALAMAWESAKRLYAPVPIAFNQAIIVAVLGLIVNGMSVLILGHEEHDHGHEHKHEHDSHGGHHHHHHEHHHDHNLRSAYLHVLADALTSFFAIFALLAGKYVGWAWLDPTMGLVGAVLVAVWSRGLLVTTSGVLLDMQETPVGAAVRKRLEADGDATVVDLHVWSIGPNLHAAAITLVATGGRPACEFHALLPPDLGLAHVTIEVIARPGA